MDKKPSHFKKVKATPKEGNRTPASTSWGHVAPWYDQSVESPDSYQQGLILPNLLRLMDIKKDERLLDIACGQGMFSREFAHSGATVSGTDISSELIDIAEDKSRNLNANFYVAPANDQRMILDADFDKAACVLALQDIDDLSGTLKEAHRALKPGGLFYAVINHPAFRIPKRSAWGIDDAKRIQFRREDEYMSEARIRLDVHPGSKIKDAETTYFHRPLQVFFKALEKAGFVVVRLEEWV